MQGRDWLSERMVFGALVIVGYLLATGTAAYLPIAGPSRDVVVGAISALGTALGIVVQSVFRTDKTDKQTADTINKLVTQSGPQP